ncbi:MAG: hypothetical protein MJY74_08555 [Bacteroidaceae bacterium]|nr:hypothetical protein [Bacteroidaceae bacterium]
MKKTFIFGLIAAALGFTACSSEDDLNVNDNMTIFPFGQGEAEAKDIGKVKWVQLWANGPKFAEYNIGANSATGYGGYYTWGGTDAFAGIDDTATKLWGSNWRMPTKEEFDSLLAKCDVKWIDGIIEIYNIPTVTGLLCTGKDVYSSNSVFLPAAGYYLYASGFCDQGDQGYYWSSTPDGSIFKYYLYFDWFGNQRVSSDSRLFGYSVRAVLAE